MRCHTSTIRELGQCCSIGTINLLDRERAEGNTEADGGKHHQPFRPPTSAESEVDLNDNLHDRQFGWATHSFALQLLSTKRRQTGAAACRRCPLHRSHGFSCSAIEAK